MLVFSRTTKKPVCDRGPDHHKAATHLMHMHSTLNNSPNHSSSLQELFYFNTRNCSLLHTIPLPSTGKEMPLTLSESAGRNSSAAAPWKDSFHLHFSSGKDSVDRVYHCISSISVMGWLQTACSFAGDFSSCHPGDNFVCFAHFWLGNLQYNTTLQFLEFEKSGSRETRSQLTFLKRLELGGLADLESILVASLKEHTLGLLNNQKPFFLLCYLILVSSEQTLGYKQMLSNVQYVTNNFPIIQLVISLLAFALAGLWYAVVKVKRVLRF